MTTPQITSGVAAFGLISKYPVDGNLFRGALSYRF